MKTPATFELQQMANKLRAHALRMTTAAGSGHPTTCCSCAEIMSVLFFDAMHFDPKDPHANDVDHFVMSKGHAAPILWAALSETGAIDDDLLTLRGFTSNIEGHPSPLCPWIRVATGSLGQGLSAGCGMAVAKQIAQEAGKIFVLLGDGECAEGAVWEAIQFAAHRRLGNVCTIVDLNRLGQSGTSYFEHDAHGLAARFVSFGWHTVEVDGHDIDALRKALQDARARTDTPTAIIATTLKGKGISLCVDKENWHGKPLSKDQLAVALAELGNTDITLHVPTQRYGDVKITERRTGTPAWTPYKLGELVATREAYGAALVAIAKSYPRLVALDADTKNSTFSERLLKSDPTHFVECFIAEQNMIGMALGLSAAGWIPCASTFAAFLSRAYDFLRMAVISRPRQLIVCGSHAGVSIGEDGPSQMAIEDLAMMRGLVESTVVYPCDAISTERLLAALVETPGVSYLRSSRPKTPVLYNADDTFPIGGSKTLRRSSADRVTLIGAGVTVHEALKAADALASDGISARVIDAYSIKPIDADAIATAANETHNVIAIEDHSAFGGLGDAVASVLATTHLTGHVKFRKLAVDAIPRSGKPEELLAFYNIDARGITNAAKKLVIG